MSRSLFLLPFLLGGCLTIQTGPVERGGEDRQGEAMRLGPSLSQGRIVDEMWIDATDDQSVVGRAVLASGTSYLVTVEGTFSVWGASQWRRVCTGTPEPAPRYRSASTSGPVGLDAAYAFAVPASSSLCNREPPVTNPGWLYRLRPEDPWAPGPTGVPYAEDHVYRFPFVGAGAPLEVMVRDIGGQYQDNYGRLRVTVHETASR